MLIDKLCDKIKGASQVVKLGDLFYFSRKKYLVKLGQQNPEKSLEWILISRNEGANSWLSFMN